MVRYNMAAYFQSYTASDLWRGADESDIKSAIKNIIWPKDYGHVMSDDDTKVMNRMVALGMIEARWPCNAKKMKCRSNANDAFCAPLDSA